MDQNRRIGLVTSWLSDNLGFAHTDDSDLDHVEFDSLTVQFRSGRVFTITVRETTDPATEAELCAHPEADVLPPISTDIAEED